MNQPTNWQSTLENELVSIRPLKEEDREELFLVASDPLIWEQHPDKTRCTREGFNQFFDLAMEMGTAFLVVDKRTDDVMGTSRYCPAKGHEDKIEIGWTFIARKYWGGQYNRMVKELMLDYAFKAVNTVLFYIAKDNFRSRKAVEKLGAVLANPQAEQFEIKSADSVIYKLPREVWISQKQTNGNGEV